MKTSQKHAHLVVENGSAELIPDPNEIWGGDLIIVTLPLMQPHRYAKLEFLAKILTVGQTREHVKIEVVAKQENLHCICPNSAASTNNLPRCCGRTRSHLESKKHLDTSIRTGTTFVLCMCNEDRGLRQGSRNRCWKFKRWISTRFLLPGKAKNVGHVRTHQDHVWGIWDEQRLETITWQGHSSGKVRRLK